MNCSSNQVFFKISEMSVLISFISYEVNFFLSNNFSMSFKVIQKKLLYRIKKYKK